MTALTVICSVQAIVIVALVYLFMQHLKDERSERWQLQERIREPQREHVPITAIMEPPKSPEFEPPEPDPEAKYDEYDFVGAINPPVHRDNEDGNGDSD